MKIVSISLKCFNVENEFYKNIFECSIYSICVNVCSTNKAFYLSQLSILCIERSWNFVCTNITAVFKDNFSVNLCYAHMPSDWLIKCFLANSSAKSKRSEISYWNLSLQEWAPVTLRFHTYMPQEKCDQIRK